MLEKGLDGGEALSYIGDQAEGAIAVSPPSHQEAERKGNGSLKVRKKSNKTGTFRFGLHKQILKILLYKVLESFLSNLDQS